MLKKNKVYYCEHCGNVTEALWNGKPSISCCGEPMKELEENSVDAAVEKHVPVIKREGKTVTVEVGETAHPMAPDHYILFIELITGNQVLRQNLIEGDSEAKAVFFVKESDEVSARAFCNKHGFWKSA